jgi:hypothetical protein
VHVHTSLINYGENCAHGAEFANREEKLRVINLCLLTESMGNLSYLEAVDSAIRFGLHLEDPIVADGVTSEWQILHVEYALTMK